MSVEAPTDARLASDDGSGDASFWEHAKGQMDDVEGDKLYVPDDIGRRTLLAGRTALPGLDPNFHTMPKQLPRPLVEPVIRQSVFIGPDYFLG